MPVCSWPKMSLRRYKRDLKPGDVLVQVVWTNEICNLMPIPIQDDSNDIIYLRDAVTNYIQWPKKGIQLEEMEFMELTNEYAAEVAEDRAIGDREPLVTQMALEELGMEFQRLHDKYLAMPMDEGASFFCLVKPGVLRPEGFHMSVGFEDIKDLMTYGGLTSLFYKPGHYIAGQ